MRFLILIDRLSIQEDFDVFIASLLSFHCGIITLFISLFFMFEKNKENTERNYNARTSSVFFIKEKCQQF